MRKAGSAASRRRASVVLPAPDGEDSTSSIPLRLMRGPPAVPASLPVSLNVLHLLAHLVDDGLELEARPCRLGVVGLGAERIGLAVELLGQEVEPAPGGLPGIEQSAGSGHVGGEPF